MADAPDVENNPAYLADKYFDPAYQAEILTKRKQKVDIP
jgi:hypothetical protein